ncbi:membrane protein [Burkholderia oklahomensis]|uniref:O-antigen ligase like membrane family protein n=1 Tax=Burkholderia oklahomensis TaxID=342113 RepID=A0AAI8BBD8_9BURK|nr:membrane protein [Burkholderia oklahomensis]AIO69131.1 O-antigen ligase like membrane family protein [Burkholderia oklahomensis]AOI39985.1 hypothetical protein WG70_10385 [Burkholderia oklahomensis EO147]KUY62147.1 hypothetical protein WG70_05485 [Burkholderia oklahomensis EO147]QPS39653.1 hypothetical protein I6G57_27955 [Burkholderia oklahomensis]
MFFFYFLFLIFYWSPAIVFQWGTYGIFDDAVPLWYKALRLIVPAYGFVVLARQPYYTPAHLLYFVFGAWCILASGDLSTIVNVLVFCATLVVMQGKRIDASDLRKSIAASLPFVYGMGLLEVFGVFVSAHTYGSELRVVSTFGGPNNAGIIFSSWALYFILEFRKANRLWDLGNAVLCLCFVVLTGSLSAAVALGACALLLSWYLIVLAVLVVVPTFLINDFFVLKLTYLLAVLNGQGETTGSFSDRVDNIATIARFAGENFVNLTMGSGLHSESDFLSVLGQFGVVGLFLFIGILFTLPRNIFMLLGLLQSVVTPFFFSFPSFPLIALLAASVDSHDDRRRRAVSVAG